MAETHEQIAVVATFRWKYPKYIIYAIPNGAWLKGNKQQRIIQAVKLKKEGMEPGIPDLCILVARGGYHGLYIEMKDRKETKPRTSTEQLKKIKYLNAQGYLALRCYGATEAIEEIDKYMGLK